MHAAYETWRVCQELYNLSVLTGFPGGSVAKNVPAIAGDTGSSLIWEYLTCWGATKPMRHNY